MEDAVHGETADPRGDGQLEAAPTAIPTFVDALFGGSRFFCWTLAPVAGLSGLSLLATVDDPWSLAGATKVVVGACGLLFALALVAPGKCRWAARAVTATVFAACIGYLVDAWLRYRSGAPQPTNPGAQSLQHAINAFVTFGLPSLWFTLRRRRIGPGSQTPAP